MRSQSPSQPEIIPFTREAFQKIELEIKRLEKERVEVAARVKQAREMGDLSENAAYKYGKIELSTINRELRRLQYLLQNGKVVEKKTRSTKIEFGSKVTLQINKKQLTYMIVSQHESDPLQGKISTTSPLGKALLGKKPQDRVVIQAPAGEIEYEILKIE